MGLAVQRFGKGRVEDEAATDVGGEEGRKLRASEEAIGETEAMFSDVIGNFGPAAKDFKEGAKMFRDAMESDTIARLKEEG